MTASHQSRREVRGQRVEVMRDVLDKVIGLDEETVMNGVNSIIRERVSGPRLNPRLSMRRARRISGSDLFAFPTDDRESALLESGADLIAGLTVAVGIHVLWQDIVRIVQRTDMERLDSALGTPTREIGMRGRSMDVGVMPLATQSPPLSLHDQIRREGAASWACWLSVRETASARRLRVLTPHDVTGHLPGELPEDNEDRELRRRVVDIELNEMIGIDAMELTELEGA